MKGFLIILLTFVGITALYAQSDSCNYYVEGKIFDRSTEEPLPFSNVKIKGMQKGTIADEKGYFRIDNLCTREFDLIFSFVGYKSTLHHHDTYHKVPAIYLAPENLVLNSIVVEAEFDALDMKTVEKKSFKIDDIQASSSSNFGQIASSISGVSMLQTGQNIAKPIIHGLHSNRVLILNDEIRHEFQNWGNEHAPEIDPSTAEEIEIVKGAATVRYGPDALGGVIMMNPDAMELHKGLNGNVSSEFHTNGKGGTVTGQFQQGFDNLSYRVSGSLTKLGDLRAPDYMLTNTAREEYSYSAGLRYHKEKLNLEAGYSRFYQELGILRGSITGNLVDFSNAINSEKPTVIRDFSYEINNPHQEVQHDLVKVKGSYAWENQSVTVKYGFQSNLRKEFDVRRGTNNQRPSINLDLSTQSIDIDWSHPDFGPLQGMAGFQWMYQDNNNIPGTNTVPFIPNFNNTRAGLFLVETYKSGRNTFEIGARYDFLYVSARGREQNNDIFINENTYQNFTGTIGLLRRINEKSTFRTNLGTAWRPPSISELYAFGKRLYSVEYGLWRYEFDEDNNIVSGDVLDNKEKNVNSEVGYKWLNTFSSESGNLRYEITGYVNYIQDFFFKRPAGITNTVRGVFPYFIYEQDDALFWGIDADLRWVHRFDLTSYVSLSYLWAQQINPSDYFIGIPPPSVNYQLKWSPRSKFAGANLLISTLFEYVMEQFQSPRVITVDQLVENGGQGTSIFADDNRNFDLIPPPEDYLLVDVSMRMAWDQLSFSVSANNLLNANYRMYTDHLRYFADQQGINLMFKVQYNY